MTDIEARARKAKLAAGKLVTLARATKDGCLRELADRIVADQQRILEANDRDLTEARQANLAQAKQRRLVLDERGIQQMAEGLRQIADLPDPVGAVTAERTVPSGLLVKKQRCPIGVIMMIYEARPNVTIDAFALCFKAGNACILKGGREALHSNEALAQTAHGALAAHGIAAEALTLLTTSDREELKALLCLDQYIDLVIPRGGTALIQFVHEHARIPTVQHFHGVCHMFVDASADIDQSIDLCATAKTSAPAACNATECVLVHADIAETFVPRLVQRLHDDGVEVRGDAEVCRLAARASPATEDDWGREFLDLILAMKVVPDIDAALQHIHAHGSNHTEAILTTDPAMQRRFVDAVQSSCTLVNASTRFNDGFQLGLGAEIGISTSKIHAYGPMGLEELTTERYVVQGNWHVR